VDGDTLVTLDEPLSDGRTFSITVSPILGMDGEQQGCVASMRDVTERK
jgi:hypothetical protein